MSARPTIIAAVIGFAASAAAVGFAVTGAGADPLTVTVDQVGWWTDRVLSAPAGDGAFEVATGPDGTAEAVAALQVSIPAPQVDSFALTLVETAGLGSEFGVVAVCRTEEQWEPADPGRLDDAPTPDCSTKVFLTRVLEERTWIGDIAPVVAGGGTVSLVVLPEYTAPVPLGTGLVSRISEVQIDATGSSTAPSSTTTTLDFATPGGGNQFEAVPDSGITGGPELDLGSSSSGSLDLDPAVPTGSVDGAPTTAEDAPTAAGSEDDGFFALEPQEASAGEGRPWLRLLFLVPLAAGFGIGSARIRRLAADGSAPRDWITAVRR